eukprot:jgi/Ulvmu1/2871/UM146_0013.1
MSSGSLAARLLTTRLPSQQTASIDQVPCRQPSSWEGIWQSRQDSAISAAVSKHLAKLEDVNVVQYQSLLQKRDYPLEEREERKGRGKKRPQPDTVASAGDVSQS